MREGPKKQKKPLAAGRESAHCVPQVMVDNVDACPPRLVLVIGATAPSVETAILDVRDPIAPK